MRSSKYQVPQTRQDKIAFLKALLQGKVKVEDLKSEITITLNLGREDGKEDEKRLAEFNRMKKENINPNIVYLTLDLSK